MLFQHQFYQGKFLRVEPLRLRLTVSKPHDIIICEANSLLRRFADDNMTVEKCISKATITDSRWAAIEFGWICRYGNTLNMTAGAIYPSQQPLQNCNTQCKGQPQNLCGGASLLHLYEKMWYCSNLDQSRFIIRSENMNLEHYRLNVHTALATNCDIASIITMKLFCQQIPCSRIWHKSRNWNVTLLTNWVESPPLVW